MNFRTSFLSSGTYADLGGKWEEKHVSKRGEFAHVFQREKARVILIDQVGYCR